MNKMINKIKNLGMIALAGVAIASCDLEQLPLNEVVLENYWTEKGDVTSSVNACYSGMQSSSFLERMFVWGEVRSDNIVAGTRISENGALNYLLKGNLISTNAYADWTEIYSVINKCNTVLHYAGSVADKDPNYTSSDLRQNQAEVTAIRTLCYFYLIRAFKDVPYVTSPSIDDNQNYFVPVSAHNAILDSLINDIEKVKENVPIEYSSENDNYGRITRNFMYSLLADMYLWRASDYSVSQAKAEQDYKKSVEYCDKVIEKKIDQYQVDEYGSLKSQISADIYNNYGYPLISEIAGGGGSSSSASGMSEASAYGKIFGSGNSFESIFELQYSGYSGADNIMVSNWFGNRNFTSSPNYLTGVLSANDMMMSEQPVATYDYDNKKIFTTYDFRGLENFTYQNSGKFPIVKYTCSQIFAQTGSSYNNWKSQVTYRMTHKANWIFYRLTDIMLMKAEAEVQLAGFLSEVADTTATDTTATDSTSAGAKLRKIDVTGNNYTTAQEYYDDAFRIVAAIYYRSNPNANKETLTQSHFTSKASYEDLIEEERHRELMFEGKRWFDLVRRARRDNSMSHLSNKVSSKYTDNAAVMAKKLMIMDFMYMPYAKRELKANPDLKQNPAYDEEETVVKN